MTASSTEYWLSIIMVAENAFPITFETPKAYDNPSRSEENIRERAFKLQLELLICFASNKIFKQMALHRKLKFFFGQLSHFMDLF